MQQRTGSKRTRVPGERRQRRERRVRRVRRGRVLCLVLLAVALVALPNTTDTESVRIAQLSGATAGRAAVAADAVLQVSGHGYGHGRGLGQWGAYGYAKRGWTAEQIVLHYYTGSAITQRSGESVRVRMDSEDTTDTVVGAALTGAGFEVLAGFATIVGNSASCVLARAVSLGGGDYRIECAPAFAPWQVITPSVKGPVLFRARAPQSDNFDDNLQVVLPEGNRWLRGDVWAAWNGTRHTTVNALGVDSYIRSVIALEMSPSWGSSGGAAALSAQAIAARSYTLASKAAHVGDTYDVCSSTCQSYGGRKLVAGGATTMVEYANTDAAVSATAGMVLTANGSPIFAEYSASTGGYSAPARPPNHSWRR